ncbi:MAG: sigma-54-dependent Fis family transcriptional regulator [Candidatus Eisenbacteria bacterium]|nr:sigma-54-dependent Fis family transcriptional regulator [Candidatus Eisenbacteria bacterium]
MSKANVLVVDDDEALRRALADRLRFWGHEVTTAASGEDALTLLGQRSFDLLLLDLSMPGIGGLEVLERAQEIAWDADKVVLTAFGSVATAVEAMKRGASDFLTKPADFEILRAVVDRAMERRRLRRTSQALETKLDASPLLAEVRSESMRKTIGTLEQAARSDATILLLGESGSGKQVLAEHLHRSSRRAAGPFVYVNCVAISDDLIESTLFGHEKGAFTGAASRKEGHLETAAGGTAFLDEIGDVSPRLQTKLLHFLETGEFERVGSTRTIRVDCRIVAATNRDLAGEVTAGRFREDLYYRLNVIALPVPSLRERREDIEPLARQFLGRFARELGRPGLELDPRTVEVLRRYDWPGNVRQLKNAIERMAVLAAESSLTPDLLPPEILAPAEARGDLLSLPYREAMAQFKRRLLDAALARTGGNQTKAAELLGVQRTYLNRLLNEKDGPEDGRTD